MKYASRTEFETADRFGIGAPNDAYAQYFVGQSYLKPLESGEAVGLANVTFEPSCRNNWHIHHKAGQTIICTAGEGWAQIEGEEPVRLTAGTTMYFPPEVKHWHGAAKDSWFSHIAFSDPVEGAINEWLEPVTDAEYDAL
ncbi:cupin domain-containing protein [Corynebacterium diphtheriae]|uniref:cupin domain-containing protein n=1 Tax=Corynebacterium diphtheriae TaxID=1717 RepID=UPI0002FE908F|nr:cupin domain-containing protein [Corynebacterium diphtheriae]OJI02014.1 hypothetical protein BKD75_10390 [Corynebacterium diphtheriae]VEJ66487.1 Cupin domain [Corynebacterium diphtheriae]